MNIVCLRNLINDNEREIIELHDHLDRAGEEGSAVDQFLYAKTLASYQEEQRELIADMAERVKSPSESVGFPVTVEFVNSVWRCTPEDFSKQIGYGFSEEACITTCARKNTEWRK